MTQERVDVLIVVALRAELHAVLEQAAGGHAGWSEARDGSGATYYLRDIENARGQSMRIAAAWLGDSGQATATMRSRRLVDELDPGCLAICGTCAGLRGVVRLGDVIVADRVFEFEFERGAWDQMDGVMPLGPIYGLDLAWKMNAVSLAEDTAWTSELSRSRPPSTEAQASWLLRALFQFNAGATTVPPYDHPERKQRCPDWSEAVKWLQADGYAVVDDAGALVLTNLGNRAFLQQNVMYPDGLPEEPQLQVHVGSLVTLWKVTLERAFVERAAQNGKKPLGADLESTAIASVAVHTNRRWFVVRGVAGYADYRSDSALRAFAQRSAATFLMTFLHRHFDTGIRAEPPSDRSQDQPLGPILLERITIAGFKNIAELVLDMTGRSKLGGHWTCLAGINGSGKTSILQAIALTLLGDKLSDQLGSVRLGRMVRRTGERAVLAEISATVRVGAEVQTLSLPLSADGIDSERLEGYPGLKEMRALWSRRARGGILAAYGASRNLSEYLDNRYESLHPEVQRQMTLFDPLARVARSDLLLKEGSQVAPVIHTLRRLLSIVLADLPIRVAPVDDALRFDVDGAELPASALPDGFRSTIAWLADVCAVWHEKARPEEIGDGDPRLIYGIVLVDEIDLHFHASLQRVFIPRLREAMPRVQWIVTTHSPLVLASFDRREIKLLDSSRPGGVRELDRDILGFSMDQIYEWLMDTKPRGKVLEEMLERAQEEPMSQGEREEIAVLVATAPDFNEEEAKRRVAWRRGLIDRLHHGEPQGNEGKG